MGSQWELCEFSSSQDQPEQSIHVKCLKREDCLGGAQALALTDLCECQYQYPQVELAIGLYRQASHLDHLQISGVAFFLVYLFILRDRGVRGKRERESREGAEREGERESQAGSWLAVSTEPDAGLKLRNHEIMT